MNTNNCWVITVLFLLDRLVLPESNRLFLILTRVKEKTRRKLRHRHRSGSFVLFVFMWYCRMSTSINQFGLFQIWKIYKIRYRCLDNGQLCTFHCMNQIQLPWFPNIPKLSESLDSLHTELRYLLQCVDFRNGKLVWNLFFDELASTCNWPEEPICLVSESSVIVAPMGPIERSRISSVHLRWFTIGSFSLHIALPNDIYARLCTTNAIISIAKMEKWKEKKKKKKTTIFYIMQA